MKILSFVHQVEEFVTEVALWFIFVPKTLMRIILSPTWIYPFLDNELKEEEKGGPKVPFDGYTSPLIFFIITVSIPVFIAMRGFDSKDFEQDVFLYNFFALGDDMKLILVTLPLLALPLFIALSMQILEGNPLRKSSIKKNLYVQCYTFAPLLVFIVFFITDLVSHRTLDALEGHGDHSGINIGYLYIVWFFYTETCNGYARLGDWRKTRQALLVASVSLSAVVALIIVGIGIANENVPAAFAKFGEQFSQLINFSKFENYLLELVSIVVAGTAVLAFLFYGINKKLVAIIVRKNGEKRLKKLNLFGIEHSPKVSFVFLGFYTALLIAYSWFCVYCDIVDVPTHGHHHH